MTKLELHQRYVRASESRDAEELAKLVAPDVVLDMSRSRGPYSGVYEGHAEVRPLFEGVAEAFEFQRFESLETYEVGDWLAVEIKTVMRGRESGVDVKAHGARAYRFAGEQIAHFVLFQSMEEAKAFVDAAQP